MPRNEMWEELCCCTVVFIISAIILLRLFWNVVMARSRHMRATQLPAQPETGFGSVQAKALEMVRCQQCEIMYDEAMAECPRCGRT